MEGQTVVLSPAEKQEKKQNPFSYTDILITLCAVTVMPVYLYGHRVLLLMLAAIGTAVVLELICKKLLRQKWVRGDFSGIVTAMITVMLMPATVPVWMPCISVGIAICVAKYPFGGTGKNIFNPAAVGVAFCVFCWPEHLLRYPVPFTTQRVIDSALYQYGVSPASVLKLGGTPKIDFIDVLLGKFAGPLGATCMIVLGTCLVYLLFRRKISANVVLAAFIVLFFSTLLFPRVTTGVRAALIYEFCSGAFVFGVIFMANDPATMPKTDGGQILYGFLLGLLVVVLRRFGAIELNFVYALLLANVFVPLCDKNAVILSTRMKQRRLRREAKKAGEQA